MHILSGILTLLVLGVIVACDGDWSVLCGLFKTGVAIASIIGMMLLTVYCPAALALIIVGLVIVAVTFG